MSLIYSPTATATVTGGTRSIAISGMDLNAVVPGMVINLGARDRVKGDGLIISNVAPNGSSGGTITTVGNVDNTFSTAAFVIDTRDYNGTAPNYLIATYSQVLNALLKLTSPLTNLFSGSRVLALDKDTSAAVARIIFAQAGRMWAALEQRVNRQAETIAIRAYPDGTTPLDSLIVDLNSGGIDFLHTQVGVGSDTTTDIGNVNALGIVISGSARIVSFGSAKNKIRNIVFANSAGILSHNASINLPGQADINIVAGDRCTAISGSDGNWSVYHYTRANGRALSFPSLAEQGAQGALGYTPVTQGGGAGQLTNRIFVGYDGNSAGKTGPKIQVDATDFGRIWCDLVVAMDARSSGYIKLPNGLIFQWGTITNPNADYSFAFPIVFPAACLAAFATCDYYAGAPNFGFFVSTDNRQPSGMNIRTRVASNGGAVGNQTGLPICWLAIGI